jgi:hypothetical protein
MALAESMKNFVNDLKASRRSRHEFVKGNREITKNVMAENRKFLQNIHAQNKINSEQTHAFLKSSKESRMEDLKKTKESIKATLDRIHASRDAITQGAQTMIKEFRDDTQKAHEYWASLVNDTPIGDTKASTVSKNVKKSEPKQVVADAGKAEVNKTVEKNKKEQKNKKDETESG